MKAYRMKLKGDDDAPIKIVITKVREIAPGYEIIGGPIGGENILPLKNNEPDKFVPFKTDDGKLIKNAVEMRKAYEAQQADAPKEIKEEEKIVIAAIEPKPKGRPGRPAKKVVDDEDDEDDDA